MYSSVELRLRLAQRTKVCYNEGTATLGISKIAARVAPLGDMIAGSFVLQ